MVKIVYASVVKELEAVAAGFFFIALEFIELFYGWVLLDFISDIAVVVRHVPLHGVAKKVNQDKDGFLDRVLVIDMDFGAVEVAREGVHNIGDHYWNAIAILHISRYRVVDLAKSLVSWLQWRPTIRPKVTPRRGDRIIAGVKRAPASATPG